MVLAFRAENPRKAPYYDILFDAALCVISLENAHVALYGWESNLDTQKFSRSGWKTQYSLHRMEMNYVIWLIGKLKRTKSIHN